MQFLFEGVIMRRRKPKTIKMSRVDQQEIERLLDDGRTEQRIARRWSPDQRRT